MYSAWVTPAATYISEELKPCLWYLEKNDRSCAGIDVRLSWGYNSHFSKLIDLGHHSLRLRSKVGMVLKMKISLKERAKMAKPSCKGDWNSEIA
jgi:hypothetical protein